MALGYDGGKLYILAFDHRGSFQKKMFGIEGDPTPEQIETIADAKRLIFEGMLDAVARGVEAGATGVLVDEQFGSDIPERAHEHGLKLAMPVEKSGQEEFDFQYGDDFPAHIEKFDPDFSKVLVRHNVEGDAEMNQQQIDRLKRLADWLHDNGRKFMFELLVPATEEQLAKVGGDSDRYDAELRPELMRRAIETYQQAGLRGRHMEDRGRRRAVRRRDARRPGPLGRRAARASSASCWAVARRPEGRGVAPEGRPG